MFQRLMLVICLLQCFHVTKPMGKKLTTGHEISANNNQEQTWKVVYQTANRLKSKNESTSDHVSEKAEKLLPLLKGGIQFDVGEGSAIQTCPTWTYRINSTSDCHCGNDMSESVKCNDKLNLVSVVSCHCITYDDELKILVTGTCFYGCRVGQLYKQLPSNVSKVNDEMCGKLNREGRLCAKCKRGFHPLLYSFDFHCINCTYTVYNWIKFIAVATIPSTFCFILIIICKINALSPQFHGFVQITQAFGAAINLRTILLVTDGLVNFVTRLIAVPYGVINLDFFRTLIDDICVDLTTLQVLSLDYITAIYPLILILLTYALIELHANDCQPIVWIWKPFHRIFKSGNWDVQYSIINAFATFLLLSYGKLLSVTFDLLVPTKVYNVTGDFVGYYLYYDTLYEYFSHDHLPYASLALVISVAFLLPPPLLLLFYPMSCFQKCLKWRSPQVHTFVECYHGYYKDGTEPGTRDLRWVSAVYFIVKIIFVFVFYGLTRDVLCYSFTAITLTLVGIFLVCVKPYKEPYSFYNKVDSGIVFLFAIWCVSVTCVNEGLLTVNNNLVILAYVLSAFIPLIPLAYILTITLRWLYKTYLKNFCKNRCSQVVGELSLNNPQPIESLECERAPLLS